jgi:hypothetical protein
MVCQQRASPLNKPPAFNFAHPSGNDSPQCWQVLSDCLICSITFKHIMMWHKRGDHNSANQWLRNKRGDIL